MEIQKVSYSQPAFKGNLGKQMTRLLPGSKAIERMQNLKWLEGEMGGILLTALGTGLVAPIFIGTNPFAKAPKNATPEEKKEVSRTKWYTAWRQPISAALAIIFQASALKPIDKFLDMIINNKEYSKNFNLHADHCEINSKSYVQTLVKKEMKEAGLKKPSWLAALSKGYQDTKTERRHFNDEFQKRVDQLTDSQIQAVADKFARTNTIKIGERTLDNPTLAELINKNIDNYIKSANDLKIDDDGLAFYSKRGQILTDNEKHLRDIFKDIPLEEIARETDETKLKNYYNNLETTLKNLISNEQNPDVKMLLQEILDKPEDLRARRIQRTLARIDNIKELVGKTYSQDDYIDVMKNRNGEISRKIVKLKLSKIEDVKQATTDSIKSAIENIKQHCSYDGNNKMLSSILHDTDVFDSNRSKLGKKIYKDITKLYKELMTNTYKPFNQAIKVLIGVCITLPITCNALNWVYPRFMEIFFPKLAGVKGGNK